VWLLATWLILASSIVHTAFAGPCPPVASETRAVASIRGAARITLDDGSAAKLMGLLPPSVRDLPAPPSAWPLEAAALADLEHRLRDRRILIAKAGSFRDRYGRLVIHAFTSGENAQWLQGALVEAGQARVAPVPGETECVRELLLREAVARAKRAGLWANPVYDVRAARETRMLTTLAGTFQIVEGWVSAVARRRNTVFLNFGQDWRWDFTAGIDLSKTGQKETIAAQLQALQGRFVRVRGYIERRNGPFVSLASADVIEELPEGVSTGR
jgi:hypothetical protein